MNLKKTTKFIYKSTYYKNDLMKNDYKSLTQYKKYNWVNNLWHYFLRYSGEDKELSETVGNFI